MPLDSCLRGKGSGGGNDALLQVIGAGRKGMGTGLGIRLAGVPLGVPCISGAIHGYRSCPLAVAPPIIERLLATLPVEA